MRETRYIPPRAAANLTRAINHASEIGRPLNMMVTINAGSTSCGLADLDRSFARIRKNYLTKWLARYERAQMRPTSPPTFVWVNEGKPGHHGFHWLVHIPAGSQVAFEAAVRRWVVATMGPITDDDAFHFQRATNPRRAGDYFLKGLHPRDAERFGVKAVWQGVVPGKRCGVSQCLGPTAIARFRKAAAGVATPRLVVASPSNDR